MSCDYLVFQDDDQLQRHIDHMTSGPCVLLSLQRENAVKKLLELIGPKDPLAARRQSQFLWRGVFGADSVLNAFHGMYHVSNFARKARDFYVKLGKG